MKDRVLKGSGILGALVFLISTGMAILNYPGYLFWGQFLSELGISPGSAIWFNTGLMISGFCFGVFFYFLFNGKKLLQGLSVLSGLSLMSVGIFPMNYEPAHAISAGLFFILTGILVLAHSLENKKVQSIQGLGFAWVIVDVIFLINNNSPVLQKITAGLLFVWVLLLVWMYEKNNKN